jgi:hypothetical protein
MLRKQSRKKYHRILHDLHLPRTGNGLVTQEEKNKPRETGSVNKGPASSATVSRPSRDAVAVQDIGSDGQTGGSGTTAAGSMVNPFSGIARSLCG